MDIVIAGGSVSAFEAAAAARRTAPEARIAVYSAESVPPYRRPALPGLICAAEADAEKILIRPRDFYGKNAIELHLGTRLETVDPAKKTAVFSGGAAVSYDRLVVAVGGRAFVPDLPGAKGGNVFSLRNFDDLVSIRAKLAAGARTAVVVGGGILGLEAVDALLKCGIGVTLLEQADRLLSRNISPEDSLMMMRALEEIKNFRLVCRAETREVTGKGVVLADGTLISGDLVLFSTGSRPAIDGFLPQLPRERGLLVDDRMRTGVEDIFACGDCVQFGGKVCGLYAISRAMAAVAGVNAAGGGTVYMPKADAIMLNTLGFRMSNDGKVTKK
ncbi:MAG: NAD(P)/FAD-dependent oxidoreductase [Lentisphaeria bacterium]|nr:NAD(P)/FAD-dependent oxidoreductase [Lentisphaeria bacterium]